MRRALLIALALAVSTGDGRGQQLTPARPRGTAAEMRARGVVLELDGRTAVVTTDAGTGRFSVTLVPGSARAATLDPGSGSAPVAFTAALHYRFIDRKRGCVPVTPEDYAARVEKMTGRLTVGLRRLRSAGSRVDPARVEARLHLSEALVGAVRDIRFDSLPASIRDLFPPCDSIGKFRADNPDDQSQDNCSLASNPLLEFVQVHCCARPEIR